MAEEIDKLENRGYADNGIAGVQGSRRRGSCSAQFGVDARPGDRGQPLHRLEAGAGDAAGRASSTPATSR